MEFDAKKCSEEERNVCILFDEMKVKSGLVYSVRSVWKVNRIHRPQDIMFAKNSKKPMPKHYALATAVWHLTGSGQIVGILNGLGAKY